MGRMDRIALPANALVVLIGPSGSGKSTFAARHFQPTEVLSSDEFRAIVADDPTDQRASRAAFELLHLAARRRLERGRLTVIDATNVTRTSRLELVALATETRRPAVAIVLDAPLEVCLGRNARREGRTVAAGVVIRQADELSRWLGGPSGLADEGFAAVHRLVDPARVDDVTIVRVPGHGRRATGAGTIPATGSDRLVDRRTAR